MSPRRAVSRASAPRSMSARERHQAWLDLVNTEGPFLAVSVMCKTEPQGFTPMSARAKGALVGAKPAFERAWDVWDAAEDKAAAAAPYVAARDAWLDVVFREVLGWGDRWVEADPLVASARVSSPDGRVSVTPTGVVRAGDRVGALVWVVDPVGSLRDAGEDGWSDSPIDRMELMLRQAELPIGIVTDGRWWALGSAPKGTLAASGIVDAQRWIEEPGVRDAFAALTSVKRLLGGKAEERLPALFAESVVAAEDITEALGGQVRKAVELVVAAFDESSREAIRRGVPDPLPSDGGLVYEAAVTAMMRVVFLLFAEERGMLPAGELFALGYGLSDQLAVLRDRERDENAEALDSTYLTWHRLLATSQALFQGATFEDMRLPAYGGSLFDPSRFDFLTATTERGTLALRVSDRVMLHVLEAVQEATVQKQQRRISFRDIDVEQIGYIYEGLLGYTCRRADEVLLGLIGKDGAEPEMPLRVLEDLYEDAGSDSGTGTAIVAWCKKNQPASEVKSAGQYAKALAAGDGVADAEQALRAVTDDADLREQLRSWLGVIRRDLRNRPVVIEKGGWVVVETPSRKNTGAHYTPRALAEEVVEHALKPILFDPGPYQTPDESQWRPKSSTEILNLKVADIACGSGAFLVAAARYLGRALVEAWRREGVERHLTPQEAELKARREVVAHCLYGADINGMAVEMCKLSLWLVSLDPKLPFSFVDDKVLHGNSLLGLTSLRQLEELHIAPKPRPSGQTQMEFRGNELVTRLDVEHRIERAISLRRALASEIDERDPARTATAKHTQLRQFEEITAELRMVADGVVAAGLALGGKPSKKLNETYENLRVAVDIALPAHGGEGDAFMLNGILDRGLTPTVETDEGRWRPLHWCIEVPDIMAKGGFDAIVGNPPFFGGTKISTAYGETYRLWLVHVVAQGVAGQADLAAYFILRATELSNRRGSMGLLATNTIAQGATREVGLELPVRHGLTLMRSIQSRSWPVSTAQLEFATIWATRTQVCDEIERVADGISCSQITSLLEPAGAVSGSPRLLAENRGQAFAGVKIFGPGFVLSGAEMTRMKELDPRNAEVIFPYPHGKDDIYGSPSMAASRWVINFSEMDRATAREYEAPFSRVEQLVKPVRERASRSYSARTREAWWQYEAPRQGMSAALADCESVIVCVQTSSTQAFAIVSSRQVFDQKLVVFCPGDPQTLSILSSSPHRLWATAWGSTRTADPVYTPSDVFETFPRPAPSEDLGQLGNALDLERREMMLRQQLGLTKLYNRVNDPELPDSSDPDIARLRQIHVEIDRAVMAAYGWDDVELKHGFHAYRQMTRWTVCPKARVEILDRLLDENHRRAALQGDAPAPADDEPVEGDED